MNNERNAFKAGLFMITSLLLVLAVIFSIRGIDEFIDRKRDLVVMFDLSDDIGGLRVGDEVRIGGYMVGTVKQIDLVPAEPNPRLSVRVAIPEKYDIRNDAKLRIQSTVTGVSMLNFESLGTGAKLADGDVIEGRAGTLTELASLVNDLTPSFKPIMTNVERATGQLATSTLPKAEETVVKIGTLAERGSELMVTARTQIDPEPPATIGHAARGMMSEIRDIIGDTKGDFRTTAANVSAATGTLKDKLPEILNHVDTLVVRVQGTVDGVNAALADIQQTAVNARDMTGGARDILLSNRSKIDGMIDSLKKTGDNLKNASAEIRRSPWRLLYKPGKGEMANLNLFDSARAFAEGAGELADATEALRDAVNAKEVDEARLTELMERVDLTFRKFNQVEQKLWQEVQE
jgi:ABC-type transporter Mla subunit MlaD